MKSTIGTFIWIVGVLLTAFFMKEQACRERDMQFKSAEDKTDRFSTNLEILWMWITMSLLWPLYWLLAVIVYFRGLVEVRTGR